MLSADSVRQFKPDDWPKFAAFIKKQFHDKYILSDWKFFEWQFRQNPCVNDFTFFLLEQDGQIYGNIGVVPLDYKLGDQTARLNTYVNLFVDAQARGLGLGTLLIKKAMAQGSPALIGGYNSKSFSIYQKLGDWREMGKFYRYMCIFNEGAVRKLLPDSVSLRGAPHLAGRTKQSDSRAELVDRIASPSARNDNGMKFKSIKTFDSSFDNFWQGVRGRYDNTVERTSSYLNWRYANHPYLDYSIRAATKNGEIIGYIIYRVEAVDNFSIARVVDFVSSNESELGILSSFIKEVKEDDVDMVDFMFSGSYHHNTLADLGLFDAYGTAWENLPMYFNPVSYAKNYINFAVWTEAGIDKESFYDHNKWYLTKGDSDQDRPNPH